MGLEANSPLNGHMEKSMAETIKFPTNIPVELQLKFDTGLECQSQFNGQDQVCYTLADDRRMYLSPAVARKIADLGIVRAVPFTICKREKQVGMRKTIEWEVALLEAPATNGGDQTSTAAATEAPAVKQSHPSNGNG